MALAPGTRLGTYEVRSLLGSGGMGEVYVAHDPRLRRDVAIKLIAPKLEQETEVVDRFIREALSVSALNHPNIVTIHEAGEAPQGRYLVMELVHGRTLREVIRQGVTLDQARDLARQVAEALAAAHARQIVHRDVKPDNVMLREDGYVKVLDFGLARVVLSRQAGEVTMSAETRTGLVLGTIGYLSPEQARGESVTTASDVFSFGVLLYELLTGQHPFHAPTPLAVLHSIATDAPVPPSRLGIEVPAALDQLVLECLQKEPKMRPGSAEIVARLRSFSGPAVTPVAAAAAPPVLPPSSTRLVGRERESAELVQAFADACSGNGRLVAVAGEPGLGKTALVEDFLTSVSGPALARVARGRCSERLAGSEAYLPFLEALDTLLRSETHGSLARLARTVAPNWYAQVRSSGDQAERPADETWAGSASRMKREMAALLDEASRLHPVVLFFDDLHWADASTVDLLGYLADRLASMRVLVIVTYRPSELAQTRHPFLSLKLDLQARGVCREVTLEYLSQEAVARFVALECPGDALPAGLLRLIYERTEGHALFLVDLLRDLKRRGAIARNEDGSCVLAEGLSALERELPESVRSMIQRKLGALGQHDRQLLSAAAVQGSDFHAAVIAQVLGLDESAVEDALDRLERDQALVRFVGEQTCPDRTITPKYRFAHSLYRSALVDALRPSRRGALAGDIAGALVQRWADKTPEIALDLAVLFETARAPLAAAQCFGVAAQAAGRLFAHREAGDLAERGLALLAPLPDDASRRGVELELQLTRALALKTFRGYAEPAVGQAYRRARELARDIQDPGRAIPVLMGLSAHYIAGGEIGVAYELAEHLLEVAGKVDDQHVRMIAEWCVGAALHHKGSLRQAHDHLEQALSLYDPQFHRARAWQVGIEPGIFCLCESARALMLLGRQADSEARLDRAEQSARALHHPQTLAFVLLFRMLLAQLREDAGDVLRVYDELATLCAAKDIAQERLWARPVVGWALFETGQRERGLAEISAGLDEQDASRNALLRPYYLQLLADALLKSDRVDAALAVLETAKVVGRDTDQQMFAPEWHRLRGIAFQRRGQPDDAQTAFEDALAVARWQGAKLFEARARAARAPARQKSSQLGTS
jgi:tetratricopeptide (TPR) repeat protein